MAILLFYFILVLLLSIPAIISSLECKGLLKLVPLCPVSSMWCPRWILPSSLQSCFLLGDVWSGIETHRIAATLFHYYHHRYQGRNGVPVLDVWCYLSQPSFQRTATIGYIILIVRWQGLSQRTVHPSFRRAVSILDGWKIPKLSLWASIFTSILEHWRLRILQYIHIFYKNCLKCCKV